MKKSDVISRQLKTLKGSVIKRCATYGVGKKIKDKVYFHLDYISDVVPSDEVHRAYNILEEHYQDVNDYNVVVYDPENKTLRFVECPDFDTASEPLVGSSVTVNLETGQMKEGYTRTIYHHKWLFVKDDYTGFDVDESYEWSKKWLSKLPEQADGTNKERWIEQLQRYNIV